MERGYLSSTNKEAAYKDAVRESFLWLGVTDVVKPDPAAPADITKSKTENAFDFFYNANLGNPNVDYTSATDKLKLIAYQKFLALSGLDFMELWTEYRRNGSYPAIPLSQNTSRTGGIPNRLLFTQNEINYNSDNVPLKGRVSGDQFTEKIWWMP